MRSKPIPQRLLLALISVALLVPIGICVLVALARLLVAMGDASAAAGTLDWIALGLGTVWVLDLVALVLLQAIQSLFEAEEPGEHE